MVPAEMIDRVLATYPGYPIALTGCRARDQAQSCCEYDFVVIKDGQGSDLLGIDGDLAEIHTIPAQLSQYRMALALKGMKILSDPSLILSSLKQRVDELGERALAGYAREKGVDALFYADRAIEASNTNSPLSSLWLKCGAYCFLEAVIARNGSAPMPMHMLAQLRSIRDDALAGGISSATHCLALERANRSSVVRCMEACIALNEYARHDYTTQLIERKARFLYNSGMYSDCYLYLGYVTRDLLPFLGSDQRAILDHMPAISMAMDLTNDQAFVMKQSRELLQACQQLLER